MEERDSKLGKKECEVQRNWFLNQPQEKQAEVIKPAFEKEFPTNEKKREATKKYGNPS